MSETGTRVRDSLATSRTIATLGRVPRWYDHGARVERQPEFVRILRPSRPAVNVR